MENETGKRTSFRFAKEEDCALILSFIRALAAYEHMERGCGRLEWCCLDWNQPSIAFYRSLGAEPLDTWTTYRVAGETLRQLAEE